MSLNPESKRMKSRTSEEHRIWFKWEFGSELRLLEFCNDIFMLINITQYAKMSIIVSI